MDLQTLLAKRQVAYDTMRPITEKESKDLTVEEKALLVSKNKEVRELNVKIAEEQLVEDAKAEMNKNIADSKAVNTDHRPAAGDGTGSGAVGTGRALSYDIPAVLKGRVPKNLMAICGNNLELAQKQAYGLGVWAAAAIYGHQKSRDWCLKNGLGFEEIHDKSNTGVITRAQAENVNQFGGVLVPIELSSTIISLMETFGVAPAEFHREPMAGDTKTIARRAGSIQAYWLTDNTAITASTKKFDSVNLVAKKLAAFIYYSNELIEDAIIDIGDDLAREIAWNFSVLIDQSGFNGNGTSTYGGVVGAGPAIQAAFGNPTTTTGGLVIGHTGSGTAWPSYVLADFTTTMSKLPRYASARGNHKWYMSQEFYYASPVELMAAAGGNRIADLMAGVEKPMFLGRPVVFVQALTQAAGASQIDAFFGDFDLAAAYGDRRQLTLATSTEIGFSADQIAIRGIQRLDINVHDVGGNNAATLAQNMSYDQTGATYYPGPVVALQSFSS